MTISHRRSRLKQIAAARLPTESGLFTISIFRAADGREHVVLAAPNRKQNNALPLVRLHSECLTGDIFASKRCDCGEQLHKSLGHIKKIGGVLIYLRQEGRGIGLGNKIKAYALQDKGLDTAEANQALGFHPDLRNYRVAAEILKKIGYHQIMLLTNNPDKEKQLIKYGIKIKKIVPLEIRPNQNNKVYLQTKKEKFGHRLSLV